MFVNSATEIAKMLNVSDKLIAITILAGGTSMPELATCVVAALKKKGQLALGNVIGSNIFNILLILGGSAVIHPLSFDGISIIDVSFFAFGALAIFIFAYTFKKNQIDRIEGGILVLAEIIYMTLLIMGK